MFPASTALEITESACSLLFRQHSILPFFLLIDQRKSLLSFIKDLSIAGKAEGLHDARRKALLRRLPKGHRSFLRERLPQERLFRTAPLLCLIGRLIRREPFLQRLLMHGGKPLLSDKPGRLDAFHEITSKKGFRIFFRQTVDRRIDEPAKLCLPSAHAPSRSYTRPQSGSPSCR